MSEFKIEKGVPIPPKGIAPGKGRPKGELALTLMSMEEGDSLIPPAKYRTTMTKTSKVASVKVTTRKIDADHIRVWRVA